MGTRLVCDIPHLSTTGLVMSYLGHFAVKKIAVGQSHSYLLNILREVRLLEKLHHPNIIAYQCVFIVFVTFFTLMQKNSHAWLETCQFSSFGPKVPTLYVLMEWAECGSLDDFIDIRLGRGSPHVHINPFGAFPPSPSSATSTAPQHSLSSRETPNDFVSDIHSRSARVRAFRTFQRATPEEKERLRRKAPGRRTQSLKAVHLLSAEEVTSLFRDVVEGLHFLVRFKFVSSRARLIPVLAQSLYLTFGPKARECALDLGRRQAYVSYFNSRVLYIC
jgi:hypothetical protein